MNNIFESRIKNSDGSTRVPVWFMRQAGRYHQHYQNIKRTSDFMSMCRTPELACEVTMGPIQDFDFDAAILFSDLLFPLEHLNMGLNYLKGPPELSWHLTNIDSCKNLRHISDATSFYSFQGEATKLIRKKLPDSKSLIGFVGSPFTLFTYATEGSHAGNLVSTKNGLIDGRWGKFLELLMPSLLTEMTIQASSGAEAVALFDTAAGELSFFDYKEYIVPVLEEVIVKFKMKHPKTKIIYYSKMTQAPYFHAIKNLPIDVAGVDWRCDLNEVAKIFPDSVYLQGNFDPAWLHLPWLHLEKKLIAYFSHLKNNDFPLHRWIAGLGHGVLIQTPEENVKKTVQHIHQHWKY